VLHRQIAPLKHCIGFSKIGSHRLFQKSDFDCADIDGLFPESPILKTDDHD
jgi:hypothetical protein